MNRHALERLPFFVYGTLIPGQPNDHLWHNGINSIETAVFSNGILYDMNYYPMLVEEGGGIVRGKLVSVVNELFRETLNRIDNLEGYIPDQPVKSSYKRVKREVMTENGDKILSWLYVGRQENAHKCDHVPGGDWVKYASGKRVDMDIWWKTIDSVLGLHPGTGGTER